MKNIVGRPSKTLLYEDVVNALYKLIDSSDIKPGDKMPSERELTESLGISRNVLREAFHVLENRGIVVSSQGKGRFLRTFPIMGNSENQYDSLSKNLEKCSMLEVYEVRQVLETKAMELIVKNASDEDIEELEMACISLEKTFKEIGRTVGEFTLHKMYAEKTGSVYMREMMEFTLNRILDMMNKRFNEVLDVHSPESEIESHKRIIEAIRERDAEKASTLMYEHIQDTINMLR